ncbi:MAG: hypothetical protein WD295_00475, partial [Bacteroidota bacterium]
MMKKGNYDELRASLSLYIDGGLDAEQERHIEEAIASNPELEREVRELRRMKELLGSRPPLPANPVFWSRLASELDRRKEEEENLLPFPQRYVPAVAAVGIVAFIAVGVMLIVQREPLLQYLAEQSETVQQVYENTLLKGNILPLFADLDKNQVLQFAMFGTLPLDARAETALRVDESSESGYRIEVGRTAEERQPAVTVDDLYREVEPTDLQVRMIDSLLASVQERIAESAFFSENNALAIDPDLPRLNRMVVSSIAANLGPAQRDRFNRFLKARHAAYAVAPEDPLLPDHPSTRPFVGGVGRPGRFLVITEDSMMMTPPEFTFRSTVRMDHHPHPADPAVHAKIERLFQRFVENDSIVVRISGAARHAMRVLGSNDFFRIQVERDEDDSSNDMMFRWVSTTPLGLPVVP